MKTHKIRLPLLLISVSLMGCYNIKNNAVNQPTVSAVFGNAPEKDDLESIFLSLPRELTADMPVEGRKRFIALTKDETMNHRFDVRYRFIQYYSDGDEGTGATSGVYLKVFSSSMYRYLVFLHVTKPISGGAAPSQWYTYILAPHNSKWLDVTDQFLPREVDRSWYFQPLRQSNVIQAGPYSLARDSRGRERVVVGERTRDIVFKDDQFLAVPATKSQYTVEF